MSGSEEPWNEGGRAVALAAVALMSVLLILSGLHSLASDMSFIGSHDPGFLLLKGVFSIVLLCTTLLCLAKGYAVSSLVPLTAGLSSMSFFIGEALAAGDGMERMDLAYASALAVLSVHAFCRGRSAYGAATAILSASIGIGAVGGGIACDAGLVISGIAFLVSLIRPLTVLKSISEADSTGVCSELPAMLLVGIHAMAACLVPSSVLDVCSPMMAVIIIVLSFHVLYRGRLLLGSAVMMYGLNSILGFVPAVLGRVQSDPVTVIVCIPLAICACMLIRKGAFAIGVGFLVLVVSMVVSVIAGVPSELVGYPVLAVCAFASLVLMLFDSMSFEKDAHQELREAASIPTAGWFLLSCVMFTALVSRHTPDAGVSVDASVLAISLVILGFSVVAMKVRMITESAVLLVTSSAMIVFIPMDMGFGAGGMALTSVFLTLGLVTGSIIFFIRRNIVRGTAAMASSIAFMAAPFGFDPVADASLLVAGILCMVSATKKAYVFAVAGNPKISRRDNLVQSPEEYTQVLCKTIGPLLVAIYMLVTDFHNLGGYGGQTVAVTCLLYSVLMMGFAVYSGTKGFGPSSLFMYMTSLYGAVNSVLMIAGPGTPPFYQQLVSLTFLPVIWMSIRGRVVMLSAISGLVFVSFMFGAVLGIGHILVAVDTSIRVLAAIFALTVWFEYDTGMTVVERRGPKPSSGPNGPGRLGTVRAMAMIIASVTLLWTGYSIVSGMSFELMVPVLLSAISTAVFATCMMSARMYVQGAGVLASGIACMSVAFGSFTGDVGPALPVVFLAVPIIILLGRGSPHLSAILCLCSASSLLVPLDARMGGALLLVAGAVAYVAAFMWSIGRSSDPLPDRRLDDIAMLTAVSASAIAFLPLINSGMLTAGLVSGLVSMCLSMAVLIHGKGVIFLYVIPVAVACTVCSMLKLMAMPVDMPPFMLIAVLGAICAVLFHRCRDRLLEASCVICVPLFALCSVTGGEWLCAIGATAFMTLTLARILASRPVGTASAA